MSRMTGLSADAERLYVALTVLKDDDREQSFGNAIQLTYGDQPSIGEFTAALRGLRELEDAGLVERTDVAA